MSDHQPADAALLRELADEIDHIRQGRWPKPIPAAEYDARSLTRAARLRALAEEERRKDETIARLVAEIRSWRWLHWDQPNAAWACQCGGANGHAVDECPECGAKRPAKGVSLNAGITVHQQARGDR